jgi:flavin reductase (DIM6/NTAB) family NADH-FMN oxidoreductase RutF
MAHAPIPTYRVPRQLANGPVVFVTSMYRGQPNVMTATWLMPMSMNPAVIGVAIQPSRLTHEFVSRSEVLGISIPTMDQLAAIHGCGMLSGREHDKAARFGLVFSDGDEIEVPWIEESVAHIECGVSQRITTGDHDVFTLSVISAHADLAVFGDMWMPSSGVALAHHLGGDQYAAQGTTYTAPDPLADREVGP